jgi:hypothetical protein
MGGVEWRSVEIRMVIGAVMGAMNRIEDEEEDDGDGGVFPGYRVLQCYTAWPAYTKWRSKVLHRVLQSATQGATFSDRQGKRGLNLPFNSKNSEEPV